MAPRRGRKRGRKRGREGGPVRRRERGAGGTGRASRGRAASAAAAAPEPRAASGRAGPAGPTGTGAAGAAGGESREPWALSGTGPGRAPRAAGSAARPVPAALRARLSAGRWERPAESHRPGQRAGPGLAAAAPGVPCGTAGQPKGKGTAGAALPVRQRPGPRAAPASRRGTINVKPRTARPRANRSARAAPEEGGGAAAVPSQRRPGRGRCRRPPLFVPALGARSGRRCGAGTALRGLSGSGSEASSYNCCCCG